MLLASIKIWLSTIDSGFAASHPHVMAGVDLALRFAAALFFWRLAWRIAGSRLAGLFLRVEPYAFLMFCAHLIMIWLAGPLIGKRSEEHTSELQSLMRTSYAVFCL